MKKPGKGIYYRMIWKEGLLILPRFLLTLLTTAAVLILATAALVTLAQKQKSMLPRIQVAVVVKDGDVATQMAVRMVGEMESVKSVCDLVFLTDEEAREGVKSGEIEAAVFLTENIYDDVNSGRNTPVEVQVSKGSGLGVQRFRDLVDVGVSMLQTGQAAVYAVGEVSDHHQMLIGASELMDDIVATFIGLVVTRNSIWVPQILSPYGDISSAGFYSVTAALAAACLLFGTGFSALYGRTERVTDLCLIRIGIGAATRSLARLIIETLVDWGVLAAVLLPALMLTDSAGLSAAAVLKLIPALLPAAFSVAAFTHMVNSFAPGESGSLFYLIVSILLFVLGGGLFPAAYLPPVFYGLSSFLPVRIWQQYLSDLIWNGFSAGSLGAVLLSGVIMAVLGGAGLRINESK